MNKTGHHLHNRVLKLNVGFLLSDNVTAAHSHDSHLDFPSVRVADDLTIDYINGPLRLSRTKEGILVQADFRIGIVDQCYRCLKSFNREVEVHIEELFTYGPSVSAEFWINADGILDLGPLVREEVIIEASHRTLCQIDCHGICPYCGKNLNDGPCDCVHDDIDPRLAKLRELLDKGH